ncbi:nucleotidyltransferase family protein [Candidatus Ponderosibacter sp. Uisw_141_02]|uniref:nucleotidyltransferase family protein n=1 Tax=Candidatus Ponderosibacter sp. Uisw_141_02 TaxID=3231000 RepID=UPI003D42784A
MRCFLLAAGLGLRLRPITINTPKCLVNVDGKPLLQFWLQRLSEQGFGPFLINSHYLHNKVSQFLQNTDLGIDVKLVFEENLKGTAGSIADNLNFFKDGPGLVMHADNYAKVDFSALRDAYDTRPENCSVVALTHSTSTPETCGIFLLDEHRIVKKIYEKEVTPMGNIANSAIFILSPEAMLEIKRNYSHHVDFSKETLPKFLGRILSVQHSGFFVDVGTPENLQKANLYAKSE